VEAPQGVQLTGTNRPRTYHKHANNASTVQLSEHGQTVFTTTRPHNSTQVTAAIAEGKRPDPFRTRKLSPPAPMVLHPPGCGRVGHRRTQPPPHTKGPPHHTPGAPCACDTFVDRATVTPPGPAPWLVPSGLVERVQTTQSRAALGTFVGELSGVGVDLGVRCSGQHPPGLVENDLLE
jgi:hypothetical protein